MLWDKKTSHIVNNESVDIMRMLNTAFNDHLPKGDPRQKLNLYPSELKHQIDEINSWMSPDLNEGVYKAGFAPTQEAYDSAAVVVFETLDRLEKMLKEQNTVSLFQALRIQLRWTSNCTRLSSALIPYTNNTSS